MRRWSARAWDRGAGGTACAVSYGYGNRSEMEPDIGSDDLCELLG